MSAPLAQRLILLAAAALLAVVAAQRVGLALVGEALEVAVDGRESHAVEPAVQLLGGHGGVALAQGRDDSLSLFRATHRPKR